MNWDFFLGMITGVGIIFGGAALWVVFYHVLESGLIKHLDEGTQEKK